MPSLERNVLFAEAPVAYSILDLDGRQLAANRKFRELFGYRRADDGELSASALTHPDDQELTATYLRELGAGKREVVNVDKRYVRADGTVFWGRLGAHRIEDADGTPLLLGVIENIDEQRRLEEQLRIAAEQRSAFVAQVSHELRNPLHTISGLAELLSAADIRETERHQAEVILRESRLLTSLVHDLLDIGRADTGHLVVAAEPVALRRLVDRVSRSRAPEASAKGLVLAITVTDSVPLSVLGDEHRLVQVLDNLVGNAIKFTEAGEVTLDVDVASDGMIVLTVSDTGVGIAPEDVDLVFQPFGRVDHHRPGAGLGLAISTSVASAMDGSLQYQPRPYGGSMFILRLPLPASEEAEHFGRISPSSAHRRSKRVLVVEDSAEIQLLVRAQLDQLHYPHDIAGDGLTALELSDKTDYAALLVDWHLPGIDGLEMIRRFRKREQVEQRPRTPVLTLTARTMPGDLEACLDAGADGHIPKPAGLADLANALDQWTTPASNEAAIDETVLVDAEVLKGLVAELGNVDVVDSIVQTYLDELPGRVARIVDAWPDDSAGVAQAAHMVKGASRVVGAAALGRLATELETATTENGRPGILDEFQKIAESTRSELEATVAELRVTNDDR